MLDVYLHVFTSGLLWIFIGTAVGIFIGSIPGLSGAIVISLSLPMTYFMDGGDALLLLISMYVGATTGGLISATLMRMPGTEAAIMTTLDGYPMAVRGEPARALGLGVLASFFGGMVAWAILAVLSPPLSLVAVRFGPYEIFAMAVVALSLIASVSRGSLLSGLLSAALGAMVSLPGIDPISGALRLTFGMHSVDTGFTLLPVILGALVLSQVLLDCETLDQRAVRQGGTAWVSLKLRDLTGYIGTYIRSSLIGTWIGILPGVGGTTASIAAYSVAKALSRTPERFGHGAEEGVIAAETANNAGTVGALVPLITLGIPGSVITAVLLGAMVIHNLNPGPLLFAQNPKIAYTVIAGALASNFAMLAIMWVATPVLAKLMYVNKAYLLPPIVVFCFIGAFSVSSRFFDVGVMLAFAVLGYLMQKAKIPTGPFIIAYILTPMAEQNLRSGLVVYDGSFLPLLTRPICLVFLVIAVASIVWALWGELTAAKAARAKAAR
ncbi:tripartite tricarboxylate transporter permease [Aurantimonas sp. VKM B-3413]|uniref:tripartite tricarboxylate transporter permease n=1 Tax=Aurantimonas sp. VKM B-3413 TaxID=2779401 RepID=UPI001E53B93A|nr:tripartite tricarboxylate transporter permease [Aurantimonas sp. VKM B-3413]MCB8840540.1 tripartite tricarboxylate transporter permease [Aurantimonas sp. VKM B-3413]